MEEMINEDGHGTCKCGARWLMRSTEYVEYRRMAERRNTDTIDTGDELIWVCPFCGTGEKARW